MSDNAQFILSGLTIAAFFVFYLENRYRFSIVEKSNKQLTEELGKQAFAAAENSIGLLAILNSLPKKHQDKIKKLYEEIAAETYKAAEEQEKNDRR